MLRYSLALLIPIALFACSDDESPPPTPPGTGARGAQGGAGGAGATGSTGGTGAVGGSGGAGGAMDVTVSGTVEIAGPNGNEPAVGAMVTGVGTGVETAVASDGTYSLTLPVGVVGLHAYRSPDWGVVEVVDLESAPLTGQGLVLASEAELAAVGDAIGTPPDEADGLVVVLFNNAVGGESVTLDLASDTTFAEVNDALVVATTLPAGSGVLGFMNVEVGTTTITVEGAPGMTACTLNVPGSTEFPVIAKTTTFTFAECTPL